MKLTKQEIDHLALLARIGVTEEEKEKFGSQISSILEYVSKLDEVDTKDVLPTLQPGWSMNVTRNDVAKNCDKETREGILANMPAREGDLLKVKPVFGAAPKDF